MAVMLIADGECDAIWDTMEQAQAEAKDLRRMGYKVRLKEYPTWEAAEAAEERMRHV